MGLHDAPSRPAASRGQGEAGAKNPRSEYGETNSDEGGIPTTRITSSSANEDQDSHSPKQGQVDIIPLECRTRLLTQAAILTTRSTPAQGMARRGVSPTAALESPSSPPIAAASSPEASFSVGSPFSHASPNSNSMGSPTSKAARKRGVPHIYRDFTNVPDMNGYIRKKTGGVTQPFPEKLHEMLDNVNEPDTVGWLPHGRAFIVRKPKEFTTKIMPKFFRQTKLTSFQRQLNLYGFRRLTQGADAGAYYHELFLRGRPQLCMRMQRQKVKGTGHKQPADAKTEPNFYAMVPSTFAASPSIEPSSPETTRNGTNYDDLSPGTQGLHGAANLLKNIAAGMPASAIGPTAFSLGETDFSTPMLSSSRPNRSKFSSFLADPGRSTGLSSSFQGKLSAKNAAPVVDGSMSLLGRVNMEPPSIAFKNDTSPPNSSSLSKKTSAPAQFAFLWPPIRRTQDLAATRGVGTFQQQESAQTSSSQGDKGDAAGDLGSSNESEVEASSDDTTEQLPSTHEQAYTEEGAVQKLIQSHPMTGPFPGTTSLKMEDSGPMESKVTNGIETEEV